MRFHVLVLLLVIRAPGPSPLHADTINGEDYIETVALKEPHPVVLMSKGDVKGSATLPAGSIIQILEIKDDVIFARWGESRIQIPKRMTDLEERARKIEKTGARQISREEFANAVQNGELRPGMSREQVRQIMGSPGGQKIKEGLEQWLYPLMSETYEEENRFEFTRGVGRPGDPPVRYPGSYRFHTNGWIIQNPDYWVPGFIGDSISYKTFTPTQTLVGEKIITFKEGQLIGAEQVLYPKPPQPRRAR